MAGETTGRIFNIQRYSIHDGFGIRTLVFLKGCPFKCLWCSNPESQKSTPELGFIESRYEAVNLCRPGGKIFMLGTFWEGLSLPQLAVMMKELTIVNSYTYAASGAGSDFEIAAALLSKKPAIAGALITHRFPLEKVTH